MLEVYGKRILIVYVWELYEKHLCFVYDRKGGNILHVNCNEPQQ
jgi:hypothetical protein